MPGLLYPLEAARLRLPFPLAPSEAACLHSEPEPDRPAGGCIYHDSKIDDALWPVRAELRLTEPEDVAEEPGSWWRDLAAGSALAALAVAAAVMFLR